MSTRHISDYKKLSLEIVYDLINHENAIAFTTDQFTLDAPEVVQDTLTSIVARAVLRSGYSGSQTLQYNRIALPVITALEPGGQTMVIADCASYQDILDQFNAKYGLNVTSNDITIDGKEISEAFEQELGPVVDYVIAAKEGSYVWSGQTTFKLRSSVQLLSDALPVTDLDGLWLPPKKVIGEGLEPDQFVAVESLVGDEPTAVRVTDDGAIRIFQL